MLRFKTNLKEVIEKLEARAKAGDAIDVSAALTVGVNSAMGMLKNRVFNESLDANNEALGRYTGIKRSKLTARKYKAEQQEGTPAYEKKKTKKRKNVREFIGGTVALTEYEKERLAHGRQIQHKDLEFNGTLRRSIVIASNERTNYVTCIINSERELQIARAQEKQLAKIRGAGAPVPVFSLSNEEREAMKDGIKNAIISEYDRLYNT